MLLPVEFMGLHLCFGVCCLACGVWAGWLGVGFGSQWAALWRCGVAWCVILRSGAWRVPYIRWAALAWLALWWPVVALAFGGVSVRCMRFGWPLVGFALPYPAKGTGQGLPWRFVLYIKDAQFSEKKTCKVCNP